MSHVCLIAADRELPLREGPRAVQYQRGRPVHTTGLNVMEHQYYRQAVDALGFEMKPFQYELDVVPCATDLDLLTGYLRDNLSPGEVVELWSLWVGEGGGIKPRRFGGKLSEFDLDTLGMLTEIQYGPDPTGEWPEGLIAQTCLTVEI